MITADLICHGVTSTKMFNDYIFALQEKQGIEIKEYMFRDKSVSWGTNSCYSYYRKDDKYKRVCVKHCPREASSYMIYYLCGDIYRENCYSCALSDMRRVSDFTLGDYWEIEREHPEFILSNKPRLSLRRGVSCILVNTEKANQYMTKLKSKLIVYQVEPELISAHNECLRAPSHKGKDGERILNLYSSEGYRSLEESYHNAVGKKMYIYYLKNKLKVHLPDLIRVCIYKFVFFATYVFPPINIQYKEISMKISVNSTFSYIKFNLNYGSALQCYALQKYLEKGGHNVSLLIDYRANPIYNREI